jgi:hypothetical protein
VPERAVALADSLDLEGAVLNTSWYGGYILWVRGESHPPLVDTRNLGDPSFRMLLRRASNDSAAFDTLLRAWNFTHAIVQPPGQPDDGLAMQLSRRPDWSLIAADDVGMLYVRRGAYPRVAEERGYRWLTPDYQRLGTLAARSMTDPRLERELVAELERARASSPFDSRATFWLGLLDLAHGDARAACDRFGEVERQAPLTPGLALRLGMAREALGDVAGARAAYRRALREPPDAPAARGALERLTPR